ncbi:MAG: hypothetical protein H0X17_00735 [Deltaproteobacteria bacterium]|nr:hypothetical protein [Deltaproteobacteria bacterium]
MRRALAGLVVLLATTPASADEDLSAHTVIYARGQMLYKSDARGKGETEVAKLPATGVVRALRTDATGAVLLVDVGGKWSWMPLDGKATALLELPCADGPAQLATDAACVLCRSLASPDKSIIVNLATGKQTPIDVPPPGSRLVGSGKERRLVWADATAVWSSPPGNPSRRIKVAPEAPLRGFLPSPDGKRAVGVYPDVVHQGKDTKPADMLMGFALDGLGARRKSIRDSVPVEWSHDGQWVLVQDGSKACIVKAVGGQYKCWRGYTAASIAPDGRYALLLGNRDKGSDDKSSKQSKQDKKRDKKQGKSRKDKDRRDDDASSKQAEPRNEPELAGSDDSSIDDVAVPPPSGPLALYRGKLDGAFTASPGLVVRVVEGAAVWIPAR